MPAGSSIQCVDYVMTEQYQKLSRSSSSQNFPETKLHGAAVTLYRK